MGQLMLVNPRKRRTTRRRKPATKRTVTVKRASPTRRRRNPVKTIRRRRNPIATKSIVNSQLTPALTAASGALGLDIILGFMPIPDTIKTGPFRHVVKGIGAIGMGMVLGNFMSKKTAEEMSRGALTVVMHSAMKEVAQNAMPNLPLGYYNAGYPINGMGQYINGLDGIGAYIEDSSASTYLAKETLSKPFEGASTAQEVEARMMQECEGHRG